MSIANNGKNSKEFLDRAGFTDGELRDADQREDERERMLPKIPLDLTKLWWWGKFNLKASHDLARATSVAIDRIMD